MTLPLNFSWLNEQLAGSGHPGYRPDDLRNTLEALKEEGVELDFHLESHLLEYFVCRDRTLKVDSS